MSNKVKLAIFDDDLRIRSIKKYDISENGKKIKVSTGGKKHWSVGFDRDSALEFPRLRKFLLFGPRNYEPLYVAHRHAKNCVNFKTEEVEGPDGELVKHQAANIIVDRLKDDKQSAPTLIYILLVVNLFLSFLMAHILGVF